MARVCPSLLVLVRERSGWMWKLRFKHHRYRTEGGKKPIDCCIVHRHRGLAAPIPLETSSGIDICNIIASHIASKFAFAPRLDLA